MKIPVTVWGGPGLQLLQLLRETHHLNAGVVPPQILLPIRCFHQPDDSFGHLGAVLAALGGRS